MTPMRIRASLQGGVRIRGGEAVKTETRTFVWVAIIAVAGWLVYANYFKEQPKRSKRAIDREHAKEHRKTQWAEASPQIRLSETQTVVRVKFYSPPFYDFPTVCYIYSNELFRVSNMVCPAGEALSLDE